MTDQYYAQEDNQPETEETALANWTAETAALALAAAERRVREGEAGELAGRLARCRADLHVLRALSDVDTFCWTWAGSNFPDTDALAARWRLALAGNAVVAGQSPPAETAAPKDNRNFGRTRVE